MVSGKVIVVTAVIVVIVAFLYSYYGYGSPSPSLSGLVAPTGQDDFNWAGYSVANSLSDPQPLVTGISGSWIVPQVEFSVDDTFSAVWIGIGGQFDTPPQFDTSLIQTGTEQDCVGGVIYYFAWYELLPSDSVVITTIDVSPGDTITASINLVNSLDNSWSIYIGDLSTGESYSQNFLYDSSRLSAEWVVERPDVNNTATIIANFGSVTFSDCKVTIGSVPQAFGYFPSLRIIMYDRRGTRLADVSNFNNDGTSFTVNYIASQ